jgi:hypothetical protein
MEIEMGVPLPCFSVVTPLQRLTTLIKFREQGEMFSWFWICFQAKRVEEKLTSCMMQKAITACS